MSAVPGGLVLRFPLERRLAAIRSEQDAQKASDAHAGVEYVRQPGWFGVRLRPGVESSP